MKFPVGSIIKNKKDPTVKWIVKSFSPRYGYDLFNISRDKMTTNLHQVVVEDCCELDYPPEVMESPLYKALQED